MHALNFNFIQRRRLASTLGLLLFAVGLAAASAVTLDYLDAREELQRVETRQARMPRPEASARKRENKPAAAKDDAQAVGRVLAQLQLPWDAVLGEIDLRADPAVALLSVEGQGPTRTLRFTGEAKAMSDVVAYVSRLRESPLLSAANLSHHEERQAGTVTVIRFSLDATWRDSP